MFLGLSQRKFRVLIHPARLGTKGADLWVISNTNLPFLVNRSFLVQKQNYKLASQKLTQRRWSELKEELKRVEATNRRWSELKELKELKGFEASWNRSWSELKQYKPTFPSCYRHPNQAFVTAHKIKNKNSHHHPRKQPKVKICSVSVDSMRTTQVT